jgi:hypothetical protein
MTKLTPDVQAIRSALLRAARVDLQRRDRRRKATRMCALGVAAVLVLSGSALAAGEVLGVIDLGGGLRAQPVNTFPAYNVSTHQFVRVHSNNYVYHVTGGRMPAESGCPTHENDIYVESGGPLTSSELHLAAEIAREGGDAPMVKEVGGLRTAFNDVPGLVSAGDGCNNPGNIERVVGGPGASSAKR